jgi:hypothetical protein
MKLPQPPQPFINHCPDKSAAINIEARPSISKKLRLAESSDDG